MLQVLQYPWLNASETGLGSSVFACALRNLLSLHAQGVVHGDVRRSNLVLNGQAACGCPTAGAASGGESGDDGSPGAARASKRVRADTAPDVGASAAPLVQACPRAVFIDFDWSGRAHSSYRCALEKVDDGERHRDVEVGKPMRPEHDLYALAAVMKLFTVEEHHRQRWGEVQECTRRGEIWEEHFCVKGPVGPPGVSAGTGSPERQIRAPTGSMEVSCDWRARGTHGSG